MRVKGGMKGEGIEKDNLHFSMLKNILFLIDSNPAEEATEYLYNFIIFIFYIYFLIWWHQMAFIIYM